MKGIRHQHPADPFQRAPPGIAFDAAGDKDRRALARGGRYRNTPADTQAPYLATVLEFLGMTDIAFVYAEGLSTGAEAERDALAAACDEIDHVVA